MSFHMVEVSKESTIAWFLLIIFPQFFPPPPAALRVYPCLVPGRRCRAGANVYNGRYVNRDQAQSKGKP